MYHKQANKGILEGNIAYENRAIKIKIVKIKTIVTQQQHNKLSTKINIKIIYI